MLRGAPGASSGVLFKFVQGPAGSKGASGFPIVSEPVAEVLVATHDRGLGTISFRLFFPRGGNLAFLR